MAELFPVRLHMLLARPILQTFTLCPNAERAERAEVGARLAVSRVDYAHVAVSRLQVTRPQNHMCFVASMRKLKVSVLLRRNLSHRKLPTELLTRVER